MGIMKVVNVEQGSDLWLDMRLGKITGTRLKSAVGSPVVREGLIYELIAEEMSGQMEKIWVNDAMRWGTEHEEEAVRAYESATGINTEVVGFCLSSKRDYLALSPDRLVKSGKKFVGAVEVKCPGTKTFIKYRVNNQIPDEYKWQVTNYFLVVNTLQWLDFVVYDPRIKDPRLQLFVKRITREEAQEWIDEAEKKLVKFRKEWNKVKRSV